MSKRVLILDTSVLCCWLQVPGKEEAGPVNDRWDHVLLGSYTYAFNRHWMAQPYYRLQFSHYTYANNRNDFLQTFGLSVSYFFTDYLGVRAFASYDLRESDKPLVPDYRKLDAGMGINLTLKF